MMGLGFLLVAVAAGMTWISQDEPVASVRGVVALAAVVINGLAGLDLIYGAAKLHILRRRYLSRVRRRPTVRGGYPSGPARSKLPRVPRGPAA